MALIIINKRVIGLAILLLIIFSIYKQPCLAENISPQPNKPHWLEIGDQACAIKKSNPKKADELFKQSIEEAKDEPNDALHADLYHSYGRFLDDQSRYKEAEYYFRKCYELDKKSGNKEKEAKTLWRIALSQHKQYLENTLAKPDITLLENAIAILPSGIKNEELTRHNIYLAMALIQTDLKNYQKAEEYIQKCVEKYSPTELNLYSYLVAKMRLYIGEKKHKEACTTAIELCDKFPQYTSAILKIYKDCYACLEPDNKPVVVSMLKEHKFDELDQLAEKYLNTKQKFPTGNWYINKLTENLTYVKRQDNDEDWIANLELLKQWIIAKPESKTARIALAKALNSYAWKARGGGWANTVSEEGWQNMRQRQVMAYEALMSVSNRPPQWYSAMQTVALGQGWEADRYNQMYNECRTKYPDYEPVIFSKIWWLQPRWFGKKGEAEDFLSNEANALGANKGDILYAQAVWYLERDLISNIWAETELSWSRTKQGMLKIIAENPSSHMANVELVVLAIKANDKDTARLAFK